jgi:small conductance mechanosensitive channel
MEETLNKIGEYAALYGLQLLYAVGIFLIGRWLAKVISNFVEKMMIKSKFDLALIGFFKNLIYSGLLVFVIIAALSKLGIQTASVIAVLGAASLAVGMALQGSLSNFAAGVMIILFKPFSVDHYVNAGGVAGTVKEITIFNTILSTPDNVKVIVPNAQITAGSITNYSANNTRRVDLVIGISYGDDIKKAKNILTQTITSDARVLKDPAPTIAVSELADSSVNFVVRPWVKSSDYWGAYFDLTENIKLALDKNGITIPFPQQDVHIKNTASVKDAGSFARQV